MPQDGVRTFLPPLRLAAQQPAITRPARSFKYTLQIHVFDACTISDGGSAAELSRRISGDHGVTQIETWPKIAVVGAGAVGGYFGGLLARAGAPVTMIGRPAFVETVNKNGLFLDTLLFQEAVRVQASTEISAAAGAEIVLFCVKTTDNAATAKQLAPFITPGALVVSLQNGVDNVEQIRAAAKLEVLPAVVYVAASVPEPGRFKHGGRGVLMLGPRTEKTEHLAAIF